MKYGNRRKRSLARDNGGFWVVYSDLMSALLLIFVLVMFFSVYQYFDMLEVKTAELLRQSGILDEKQAALTASQAELQTKEAKLTEAEKASVAQQAKLLLQQDTLDSLQAKLDEQGAALNASRVSLDEAIAAQRTQQTQLEAQQTQLNTQQTQLDTQQQKLDKLVGVKAAIIGQVMQEFSKVNLKGARVDASGAIVFDSEMMFAKNRSELNDVGREFLNSFIPNYLKVLLSDEYSKYVSQIIVEGHTDTDGTFLWNVTLSQNRAAAVLSYILGDEFTGITPEEKAKLEKIVTASGRSYSDPILNADGTVNMDASRRVVIKFRLNDEDMVNEMLAILEGRDQEN